MITKENIATSLSTRIFGREIHVFEEVGSTQDIARTMVVSGSPEGTIIVANTQKEGRGRLGREWVSPEGGLWFSLVLIPPFGPEIAMWITLLSAISVVEGIKNITGLMAQIKWPNDILIHDKKVAGILTEMSSHQVAIRYIVLGIGINVNIPVERLPEGATSIQHEIHMYVPLEKLMGEILQDLEKNYIRFKKEKSISSFVDTINELMAYKGEIVEIITPEENIRGRLIGIGYDGWLVIDVDGKHRTVITGELSCRR
jgi:BirA family biotin operon repressor/biotin-[acetyl-CoA-carboxylase] ligase